EKMSIPIFSNIIGGLNSILMIASIGLDISELSNASTYNEKIVLGTKLAIDMTGLGLAIASLAGSEVAGPLSVPFAGLAFAGQALNSRFAELNAHSLEVAKEFNNLKKEYLLNEKQYQILSSDRPFLSFAYNFTSSHEPKVRSSVIKTIDLSKKREITVTFGDNHIMQTVHTDKRNQEDGYYCFTCRNPSEKLGPYQFENYYPNNKDYFGLRELLNLEDTKIINLNNEKFDKLYQNNLELMMPITPESYLWYEYGPSRGILSSAESEDIKTAYEMQNNSNNKFLFAFSEPIVDHAITKVKLKYVNTNINIILGEESVKLITPTIPDIYKDYINYSLNGTKGGKYTLQTQKNVKYKISGTGLETFYIILDDNINYSLYSVKLKNNKIIIDNNEFEIDENNKPKNIIFHYKNPNGEIENAIYDVNTNKLLINNIHFDFDGTNVPNTLNELKSKIESLAGIYQKEGFIEIGHFPIKNMPLFVKSIETPASMSIYYKGWYDLKKNEFVTYLNQYNPNFSVTALEFFKFKLLGKFNNNNYYYDVTDDILYFEDTDHFLKQLIGNDIKVNNPIFRENEGSILFTDKKTNNLYNINLNSKKISSALLNFNLTNGNKNEDHKFKEFIDNIGEYDTNLIDKNFNVLISPKNIFLSLFIKEKINENSLVIFTNSNLNETFISTIFSENLHNFNLFYHDKVNSNLYIFNKNNQKKLLGSNIKNAQFNQGSILAELNDGSQILFKINAQPILLLLNIISDKETDIKNSLRHVKNLVPNLKINSDIITNLSNVYLTHSELSELKNVPCL
ncbi:MAG: hypothetical protein K2X69_15415, partial [Silvanigrellaceae bacterium]|nr:hypothetical protein [Silvanigrellaceae bacterium]